MVTLGVALVAALMAFGGTVPELRSAHARPGVVEVAGQVAATPAGKLFHDPKCSLIHGPRELMEPAEAQREGYTPCTRCLARASSAER